MLNFSYVLERTTQTSASYFMSICSDPNTIGTNCNISASPCKILNPCENEGTCLNATENRFNYTCLCKRDFDGIRCQYHRRFCRSTTCWNNGMKCFFSDRYPTLIFSFHSGTCHEMNTTFKCQCAPGWTGVHCEKLINYCENITCENKGVCRPLLMDYRCECLGESFSGQHCQIVSTKFTVHKYVSRSVAYIAILCLIGVGAFVVIMDVLKYCFGIDLTKEDLERIRREKAIKRAKQRRQPVIERFTYVDAPTTTKSHRKRSAKIEETSV